jgi:hypothetical protein
LLSHCRDAGADKPSGRANPRGRSTSRHEDVEQPITCRPRQGTWMTALRIPAPAPFASRPHISAKPSQGRCASSRFRVVPSDAGQAPGATAGTDRMGGGCQSIDGTGGGRATRTGTWCKACDHSPYPPCKPRGQRTRARAVTGRLRTGAGLARCHALGQCNPWTQGHKSALNGPPPGARAVTDQREVSARALMRRKVAKQLTKQHQVVAGAASLCPLRDHTFASRSSQGP